MRFLAAAWMGFTPPDDAPKQYMTPEAAKGFAAMINSSNVPRAP